MLKSEPIYAKNDEKYQFTFRKLLEIDLENLSQTKKAHSSFKIQKIPEFPPDMTTSAFTRKKLIKAKRRTNFTDLHSSISQSDSMNSMQFTRLAIGKDPFLPSVAKETKTAARVIKRESRDRLLSPIACAHRVLNL